MGLQILEIYFLGALVYTSLSQNILSPPPEIRTKSNAFNCKHDGGAITSRKPEKGKYHSYFKNSFLDVGQHPDKTTHLMQNVCATQPVMSYEHALS